MHGPISLHSLGAAADSGALGAAGERGRRSWHSPGEGARLPVPPSLATLSCLQRGRASERLPHVAGLGQGPQPRGGGRAWPGAKGAGLGLSQEASCGAPLLGMGRRQLVPGLGWAAWVPLPHPAGSSPPRSQGGRETSRRLGSPALPCPRSALSLSCSPSSCAPISRLSLLVSIKPFLSLVSPWSPSCCSGCFTSTLIVCLTLMPAHGPLRGSCCVLSPAGRGWAGRWSLPVPKLSPAPAALGLAGGAASQLLWKGVLSLSLGSF